MSQPASSRRVAIAYPMRPVPTQPSVLSLKSKSRIGLPANVCTTVREAPPPCQWRRDGPAAGGSGALRVALGWAACNRLQDGTAHVRDDGGRLGGTRPLRPPPRGAAGADLVAPRRVGAGRAALLRHDQHPLHHRHPHRHVGAGQAEPLLSPPPARRADHVGLRLGGAPPPALQPVARRRPLAGRHLDPPRRHVPRVRAGGERGGEDSRGARAAPTRTCTPTARCAPATPPTSTSSTASWGTGRATTARSRWRARRRRWSTPTNAAATTSTPRST